jgi:TM2 domain-containing membrane protein YozV
MKTKGTSYLLWLTCLVGLAGTHRLYNGKIATGLLWLFTWGVFGLGQFVDLFLIPDMVDERNARLHAKLGYLAGGVPQPQTNIQLVIGRDAIAPLPAETVPEPAVPVTGEQLMIKLLRSAQLRGGKLSVTQGVLDTESSFEEVETTLKAMVQSGYVSVSNDPNTGIIVYDFVEL